MEQVFEISRKKRKQEFSMEEAHYHPYYEMYYLMSGQCRMFIDHTIYYVNPGDVILITPMTLHRVTYENPVNERIVTNFSRNCLADMFRQCGEEECRKIFSKVKIKVPAGRWEYVEKLLQKIEYEEEMPDAFSAMIKQNQLYELLAFLGRIQEPQEDREALDEMEDVIQETARYIYENFSAPITLNEMAERTHMSPAYFSKKFKKITGFGFKEYMNQVRVREAARLLRTTDLSVTEIALQCGYNDGNYFGDAFRRIQGSSPNQYRKAPHSS